MNDATGLAKISLPLLSVYETTMRNGHKGKAYAITQ
jgi:hypothetical protein